MSRPERTFKSSTFFVSAEPTIARIEGSKGLCAAFLCKVPVRRWEVMTEVVTEASVGEAGGYFTFNGP